MLILFIHTEIYAKIYKYTDSKGITHYSDQPFYSEINDYSTSYKDEIIELECIDCAEERFFDNIIHHASTLFEIDPALIKAIIKVESDFNPRAVSHAGAKGLMQLMPKTAYEMEVINPFNPEENIVGGTKYFRYLLNRFDNDLKISLAAYNAGETAVIKNGGVPGYKETKEFITKVMKYYNYYKKYLMSKDRIIQYVDENNIIHITNTSGPFLESIYP